MDLADKAAFGFLITVVVLLLILVWMSYWGLKIMWRLKQAIEKLTARIGALESQSSVTFSQVKAMKEGTVPLVDVEAVAGQIEALAERVQKITDVHVQLGEQR